MRIKRLGFLTLVCLFIFQVCSVSVVHASARSIKKSGVEVGIDTFKGSSGWTSTAAWNLGDLLRLSGRYGSGTYYDSFSADLKFFPLNINFAPFLVSGYYSGKGKTTSIGIGTTTMGSITVSTKTTAADVNGVYVGGGLDWLMNFGLNIGLDYKILSGSGVFDLYLGFFW